MVPHWEGDKGNQDEEEAEEMGVEVEEEVTDTSSSSSSLSSSSREKSYNRYLTRGEGSPSRGILQNRLLNAFNCSRQSLMAILHRFCNP